MVDDKRFDFPTRMGSLKGRVFFEKAYIYPQNANLIQLGAAVPVPGVADYPLPADRTTVTPRG